MNKWVKYSLISLLTLIVITILSMFIFQKMIINTGSISHFEKTLDRNMVQSVVIKENIGKLEYQVNNKIYSTGIFKNYFEINNNLISDLNKNNVNIKVEDGVKISSLISKLIFLIFLILIFYYIFYLLNSFSKSDLELIKNVETTFDDIGGLSYVKKELNSIVELLKDPEGLKDYVDKLPKGILFEGDPGNGKTLLAKALAGTSKIPFYYINGSDIEGSVVSQGVRKLGNIFRNIKHAAKMNGRVILFIDELDSIGLKRESKTVVETNQTLNKLLTELDGFTTEDNILVIGATNLVSSLDSALLRSGRFDRIIKIPKPNLKDRKEIISLYLEKRKDKIDSSIFQLNYLDILSDQTSGFSGADLFRLVNDAFILAFEDNRSDLKIEHLRESYLRIIMGLPNDNLISKEEENIVAYHESAHAIISMVLSDLGVNSVSYATIRSYGESGGHVALLDNNKFLYKKSDFYNKIKLLLAGRAIEDLLLNGNYTSSASDDLMKVNKLIYDYITKYGMSSSYKNLYLDLNDMKYDFIQDNIKEIREELYQETIELVEKHMDCIVKLAEYLLKYKEIDHDKIIKLFGDTYPPK